MTTTCNTLSSCNDITVTDPSTVNLENPLADLIKVYPNPAKSAVFFSIKDPLATKIYIIDINGKIVEYRTIKNPIEEINLSNFQSGIYTYQILSKNNKVIRLSKLNVLR